MWVYNLDNFGFIIHETQEEQQLLVSFFYKQFTQKYTVPMCIKSIMYITQQPWTKYTVIYSWCD